LLGDEAAYELNLLCNTFRAAAQTYLLDSQYQVVAHDNNDDRMRAGDSGETPQEATNEVLAPPRSKAPTFSRFKINSSRHTPARDTLTATSTLPLHTLN
jgi:hypothetical protein